MAGTKIGGDKAAKTNKERYGDDFYKRIAAKGGKASGTGGFYNNPEAARKAGAIGGAKKGRARKDTGRDTSEES